MRIDVHHYHHYRYESDDDEISKLLKKLLELLIVNNQKLNQMGQELDTLTTEVSETKGVLQSAKVLIEGFAQALKDAIAKNDPAALKALADDLNTNTNDLATAIAANPLPTDPIEPPAPQN